MKAKDLTLKAVNKLEDGTYEIKEFKPYKEYQNFIGNIKEDTDILMPTGITDEKGNMIYSGDYLCVGGEEEDYIHPICVEWNDHKEKWCLYINGCEEFEMDDFYSDSYLIIGNKYTGIQ